MQIVPWVAAGGAVGAVARWGVTVLTIRAWGDHFPYGTLLVNVIGSFVMGGLLIGAARSGWSPGPRMMLTTGLLGAFTTFSTFSAETVIMLERSRYALAGINLVGNAGLCVVAAGLGMAVARATWP